MFSEFCVVGFFLKDNKLVVLTVLCENLSPDALGGSVITLLHNSEVVPTVTHHLSSLHVHITPPPGISPFYRSDIMN